MDLSKIKKTNAYLSFLVVIAYVLTGFGITRSEFIEKYTFGLLTKSLSIQIHNHLIGFLIFFMLMHLFFSCPQFERFRKRWEN